MRALLATVLCAQVVLGAFAGGASRAALAQAAVGATLTILAPSVDVALGGADFVPAQDGQTLRIGDQVRTGSAGVALLTFFDGSETQLTSGTQTEIDASTRGYFQSSGTTVNRVRVPAGVGFGTDTAPAAALVRGTTYLVTVRRLPVAMPGAANADGDPAAMPLPSDAPRQR